MFSLATVFGSLEACRQPATVRPTDAPPTLSVPNQSSPTFPTPVQIVPQPTVVPMPARETEPTVQFKNIWKPAVEPRDWTSIVLHHTATNRGSVESIHEAHVAKEWLGIGYHFVIGNGNGMPDGEIEQTFRWREQLHGAHAGSEEYNQRGIGIALVGNFEEQPPTPAQLDAIKRLVAVLKSEYEIDSERVIGHGEVKATACPGKLFPMSEVSTANVAGFSPAPKFWTVSLQTPQHNSQAASRMWTAPWFREPQRFTQIADLSGSRLQ